jgi:hypothetical protein
VAANFRHGVKRASCFFFLAGEEDLFFKLCFGVKSVYCSLHVQIHFDTCGYEIVCYNL